MAVTSVKLEQVVYPLLGIAAYWAWSSAVMITSGIWPESPAGPAQLDWLANVTSHCAALAVLSLLLGRLRPQIRRERWGWGCTALIALGTVLVAVGNGLTEAAPLTVAGSACSGLGTAGALLFWASALMAVERKDVQHLILAGSIIVALVVTVLILCLPPAPGTLLCIALPFAITLCRRGENGGRSGQVAAETASDDVWVPGREETESTKTPSRTHVQHLQGNAVPQAADCAPSTRSSEAIGTPASTSAKPTVRKERFLELTSLYLCCFIMALAAGMYQSSSGQGAQAGSIEQWRTLYASVCILMCAAVYLDVRLSSTRLSHLFSRLIVPLIAGGLLIIAAVGDDSNRWGGVPMQTGYHLFLIYIYTQFAVLGRTSSQPLSTFARGTVAIDVGLLAGYAFMAFAGNVADDGMRSVILAVVYLLLLVGVLLFPNVIASVAERNRRRARLVIAEQDEAASANPSSRQAADGETVAEWTSGGGATSGPHNPDATAPGAALSKSELAAFAAGLGLSPREQEVLEHLLRGRTLPAIASEAHLSYNTVKTHVSHIYQKAAVHTRDELIDLLEKRA